MQRTRVALSCGSGVREGGPGDPLPEVVHLGAGVPRAGLWWHTLRGLSPILVRCKGPFVEGWCLVRR